MCTVDRVYSGIARFLRSRGPMFGALLRAVRGVRVQ